MQPCPNCEELVEDTANFCHLCGERIVAPPPPPPVSEPPEPAADSSSSRRTLLWLAATGAVFVLVVLMAMQLAGQDPESDGQPQPPAETRSGSATDSSVPAPDPQEVLAATGTTRLTLQVDNCADCEITAVPADGSADQTATVSDGVVQFALPQPSTLALAFTVSHPQGYGSQGGRNAVVLAPYGAAAGEGVDVADLIDADVVAICWAGTVQPEATLAIAVDPFGDGTANGDLRVWADPATDALPAPAGPTGAGTVDEAALTACTEAFEALA